jgi:hypothetical protein
MPLFIHDVKYHNRPVEQNLSKIMSKAKENGCNAVLASNLGNLLQLTE